MAAFIPGNSTNVRLDSPLDPWPLPEPVRRAPRVALALWAAVVVAASLKGVFARLEPEAYAALVVFVAAIALIAARVDADVREIIAALPHQLATALLLDAVTLASLAVSHDAAGTAWTAFPAALGCLVLMPLALVVHAAARTRGLRTAPGASPGAKRAAT